MSYSLISDRGHASPAPTHPDPIFAAGYASHAAGQPRASNPVPYCLPPTYRITAEQSARRVRWFDGWDAAEEQMRR